MIFQSCCLALKGCMCFGQHAGMRRFGLGAVLLSGVARLRGVEATLCLRLVDGSQSHVDMRFANFESLVWNIEYRVRYSFESYKYLPLNTGC